MLSLKLQNHYFLLHKMLVNFGNFMSRHQVGYGPEVQCCKGVVDPITLISMIGGIAAITAVLYYTVTKKIVAGRKKRSLHIDSWHKFLISGKNIEI